jgi:hypothetical protein
MSHSPDDSRSDQSRCRRDDRRVECARLGVRTWLAGLVAPCAFAVCAAVASAATPQTFTRAWGVFRALYPHIQGVAVNRATGTVRVR